MDEHRRPSESGHADLVALMRSRRSTDQATDRPPAGLWDRIAAAVADESTGEGPVVGDGPSETAEPATLARVVPMRHRRTWISLGAAVALAACAALALVLVSRDDGGGRELASVPLSNAGLASFPVEPRGTARLVDAGGRVYVDVSVDDLPATGDGYVEVWLIDRDVVGMVSLGPYHGADRYEVPAGVDPARFPVVDVSLEPTDGVPTHSGVSVVRGVLPLDAD